jgi:dihydroorotate dehydrogenase (NAD+) catalytic subunit
MPEPTGQLRVAAGRLEFKSPILLASGCASFGEPFEDFFELAEVGALITKAVTSEPRAGNDPVRICETPAGMLNTIGLHNPGVEEFAAEILPGLRETGAVIIVNIAGHSEDEYLEVLRRLRDEEGIYGFELNLSCPNVDGGTMFATDPVLFGRVCEKARSVTERRLIPKLSPAAGELAPYGKIAHGAGMDGVTVSNTHPAMALDWRTGRSKLSRPSGGLSGPAVKPLTLYNVRQVAQAVPELPILASGGCCEACEVIEFVRAGALAVQLGTILFSDPLRPRRIHEELPRLIAQCGADTLQKLRGRIS